MKIKSLALIFVSLFFVSCSNMPKVDPNTPEGAFAIGEKYEKDSRFEEAIAQFTSIKNKHPYSHLATESELKIADIQFKREDFAEAQISYETFKELHPSHSKMAYVVFRIGQSLYKQLPDSIDRDLSLAEKCIETMNEILNRYPQAEYAKEAQEVLQKTTEKLAEKELYVADFYFKRGQFDSALGRYEDLKDRYPQSRFAARALKNAMVCAKRLDDDSKGRILFNELERRFPESKEYREAKEALGGNG